MTELEQEWLAEQMYSWQRILEGYFPDKTLSLSELVSLLLSGNFMQCLKQLLGGIKQDMIRQFVNQKEFLFWLVFIGIFSALIHILAEVFEKTKMAEIAFFFCLLVGGGSLIGRFLQSYDIAQEVLEEVSTFGRLLGPSYLLSISLADGVESGIGSRMVLIFVLQVIERIYVKLLLPMTKGYMLLLFMNALWKGDRFRGILELMKKGMDLILKASFGVVSGSGLLQTILSKSIGRMENTTLAAAAGSIPGIGDWSESIVNISLNCAGVMKNTMGVTLILVLLVICSIPLLRLLVFSGILRVAGAMVGFIGEQKMVQFLNQVSEIQGYLCKITSLGLFLFLISVAITCSIGSR